MRDKLCSFRNLGGARAYDDNRMRHKLSDWSGWQRMMVEDYATGLLGFPDSSRVVQFADLMPRNIEVRAPSIGQHLAPRGHRRSACSYGNAVQVGRRHSEG